jgi:hypothetical protein
VLTKDQAQRCADELLEAARAATAAKTARRLRWLGGTCPELSAWPVTERLAVWRQALAATQWQRPVVWALAAYLVPCLALAACVLIPNLRALRLPVAPLSSLPIVGMLLIQQVHRSCARHYLRSMAPAPRG